jgi:hypothetical protein
MWNKGFKAAIQVAIMVEQMLPKEILGSLIFGKNHIQELFESDKDFLSEEWYYIEAYQNCREQGVRLWFPYVKGEPNSGFSIFICYRRKTDDIGYYIGEVYQPQGLSDSAYKNGFTGFVSNEACAKGIVALVESKFGYFITDDKVIQKEGHYCFPNGYSTSSYQIADEWVQLSYGSW